MSKTLSNKKQSSSRKSFSQSSAKRNIKKRYTHYPSASQLHYPKFLHRIRYKFDKNGEKLVFDPAHTPGEENKVLDLRPWRSWKNILENLPISPEEINLSGHEECTEEFLEYLVLSKLKDVINSIILQNCILLSESLGFAKICQLKLLHSIDLSENNQVTDELLIQITQSLPHITTMVLKQCPNVTDRGVMAIANRYLDQFLHFTCTHNLQLTQESIQELLYRCEYLETLNIEYCTRILFVGIVIKERDDILQYIKRSIRTLNITGCCNIQYYSLCWMSIALPQLQWFSANHIPLLDDYIVKSLLGGCHTTLTHLHLNYTNKISINAIQYLSLYAMNLIELSLARMDAKMSGNVHDLQVLFMHIPHLQTLDLSENPNSIIDECFLGPEKQYSSQLTSLNISETGVTTYGIVCIVQSFPYLEYFNISGNKNVNDIAIQGIVKCCGPKQLRYFHANACPLLTNTSIQLLCTYCPHLLTLSLSYALHHGDHIVGKQYTDDCLDSLFFIAKKLHTIILNNQLGLTFTLKSWLKKFSTTRKKSLLPNSHPTQGYNYSIRSISLLGCEYITNILHLQLVFQHCYALQEVILPYQVLSTTSMMNKESISDGISGISGTSGTNNGTYVIAGKEYYQNTILTTKAYSASVSYWQDSFQHTLYTTLYSSNTVEHEIQQLQQSLEIVINTKKTTLANTIGGGTNGTNGTNSNSEVIIRKPLQGYHILTSYNNANTTIIYRDQLIQRRLTEYHAIQVIWKQYTMYCIWKKFKLTIMARRIYKILYLNHQNRQLQQIAQSIYYNMYARKIQHFCLKYIIIYNRAIKIIKKYYFQYLTRKRIYQRKLQTTKIILIQKHFRGMLVRLSTGYTLCQIYLNMPLIWKEIANISPPNVTLNDFQAHKNHRKGITNRFKEEKQYITGSEIPINPIHLKAMEINGLTKQTQAMLTQIHSNYTNNGNNSDKNQKKRRLHSKIPILIPQSFDILPYVSLNNGKKIDYYHTSNDLFNQSFQSQRKNKNFTELSLQSQSFLLGGGDKHHDQHMKLLTSHDSNSHTEGNGEYQLLSIQKQQQAKQIETKLMLQKLSIPIHIYEMKYWPMIQPPVASQSSQTSSLSEIYNPLTNNFDLVMYNSHTILYCEQCQVRLVMISCSTCVKRYCFHCAITIHTLLIAHNHEMTMMEPRIVVNTTPTHSLLYHIDTSKSIVYDLKNIIKFLSSTTELQAMQKERALLKQYELDQEKLRNEILSKTNDYHLQYRHATIISLLYRVYKAKQIVKERRIQKQYERCLTIIKTYENGILKFLKLYRTYIIRIWMYRHGFSFNGMNKYVKRDKNTGEIKKVEYKTMKKMKNKSIAIANSSKNTSTNSSTTNTANNTNKTIAIEEKTNLLTTVITRRVYYQRNQLIGQLQDHYIAAIQICEANISYWETQYTLHILPHLKKYTKLRDESYDYYKVKQAQFLTDNLSNTTIQKELNDKQSKYLYSKYENIAERLENYKNIIWWLLQHLRYLYRKSLLLPLRLDEINKQLLWISEEYQLVSRLDMHSTTRINAFTELITTNIEENTLLYGSPKVWLEEHVPYIQEQLNRLDGQQASLLQDEIHYLTQDYYDILSLHTLISELIESLLVNNQWQAEKLGIESKLIYLIYGSKESIQYNESLVTLKTKQKYLSSGTIDSLKIGLQEKYDHYDTILLAEYTFTHDSPDYTLDELINAMKTKQIECILIHPYHPLPHITMKQYLSLYSLQPWISKHAIEDIRYQERYDAKGIKYGLLQEEMDGTIQKQQELTQAQITVNQEIKQLTVQKEALQDSSGPNETEIEKEYREKEYQNVTIQLQEKEMNNKTNEIQLQEYALLINSSLLYEMNILTTEMNELAKILKDRKASRDKSIKAFFQYEQQYYTKEMTNLTNNTIPVLEDHIIQLEDQAAYSNQYYEFNHNTTVTQSKDIQNELSSLHWPDTSSEDKEKKVFFFIPPHTWERIRLQYQQTPAIHCPVSHYATILLQMKIFFTLTSKQMLLQANLTHYQMEINFFQSFLTHQHQYETCLDNYINELQFHKKQRSLELDLLLRKDRLTALYEIRIKQMIQYKQQLMIQEAIEKKKADEIAKNKAKSAVVQLAQQTKKLIRGVNDKIRDIRYAIETGGGIANLDEEEQRMAKNIAEKNKDTVGNKPEGIRNIHITTTYAETTAYQRLQDHLASRRLPYSHPMEQTISMNNNQIVFWYEMTFNPDEFITDLLLTHKDINHDLFHDYLHEDNKKNKAKFQRIEITSDCNLIIYIKRDPKRKHGLKKLALSFTEQDEIRLGIDGYEKIEPNLHLFEPLPDISLWVMKLHKRKVIASANTDSIIAEIMNVREMMSRHPNDRNLPNLLTRLNKELEICYKKELSNEVTNPIKVAVELMALDENDLELWLACFEKFDISHRGKLTLQEIFEYLNLVLTDIGKEIFNTVDAFDHHELIEFGDFLRAIGTFCFFGTDEIIRFLYVYLDKARKGMVAFDQFEKFIHMLHPYDKIRAIRALKGLKKTPEYQINFEEFRRWNGEYPALYLPVFLIQDALRKKTLGVDWWFVKLSKYENVRTKLVRAGDNTDQLVEIEVKRFQEDEARNQRIKQREIEIKNEQSDIRKTILKARQFVDEVS